MLTSKQRALLRKAASGQSPVFQIGKEPIGETLIKATADCIAVRELIKLRVLETSTYTAREAANLLAEETGAEVVQVIGRVFVLFKRKKKDSGFSEVFS